MVRQWLVCLLFLAAGGLVCAQSNQIIDELLAQDVAHSEDVAYMLLVGGGWIEDSVSPEDAFDFALNKGWLPKQIALGDPLSLQAFSRLAMHSLSFKGGLGWMLFRSERYAYRELQTLGLINTSGGPLRQPGGEEVLGMIGKLLASDRRQQ